MNKIFSRIESAFKSLMRQKSRTILTMIAVAIGIASLIIMISAGNGLESMVSSELEAYGTNVINIEVRIPGKGTTGSASGMASGITITTFKNSDIEAISKLPNVDKHYSYVTGQEIIKNEGNTKSVMVFGYGANAPLVEKIKINEGRFYTPQEEESITPVIVLGSAIKEFLFGDADAIGRKVTLRNIPFRVVGVVEKRGATMGFDMDSVVYVPTLTMQKRLLNTDYVIGMSVSVKDAEKINETKEDIIRLLRERHDINNPDGDDFEVMTMAEAQEMVGAVFSAITLLLSVIAAVSLLVGGVGITNIMYVSVVERTFEVGLRRAVGAKRNDILWQFLAEATILTFLGGVLGVIIGVLISYLIYYVAVSFGINWSFNVSIFSVMMALVFSASIGIIAGVYPAKEASKTDPINALRKE
jgi:ABC-type antimicrobial peptide transport system permease subunit